MLLLFGQLGATYAVYTALFVFVGIFVFYLFLLITKVFSHGIKVLIKTAAEKHLRVRGRESEVVDRRQRLRVRASFFLYLVIVSDAVFVLDFVVVSIFVDEVRAVQRPVHPIRSIGARASGGPGKGPCIV